MPVTHCNQSSCRRPQISARAYACPSSLRRGEALLTALGANETLTSFDLQTMTFGGVAAAAALAASLRSNSTLRNLSIYRKCFNGEEEMAIVLAALAGNPESPSLCRITHLSLVKCQLDLPALAALGESIARGATLEELEVRACEIGDHGAALIAEGIVAAGPASRLRLLALSWNGLGLKGTRRRVLFLSAIAMFDRLESPDEIMLHIAMQ